MAEAKEYVIESRPSIDKLRFPKLHILAQRRAEDGVMAGHCLDCDIWAFSEQSDDLEALKDIYRRINEMFAFGYLTLRSKGALECLYKNKIQDPEKWKKFEMISD